MATILSNNLLVNGLRTEFVDTYLAIKNRQADSRLGLVMDLTVQATNREHDFAYLNAAPHFEQWKLGETIPTDAMDSVKFNVPVFNWARRVPWSKWDRADDQTQSMFDMARMAGESAALVPERLFFGLLGNDATDLLPAIPNAPDGAAFFSTTDGASAARFGITNGNLLTGTGVTTVHDVQADYYSGLEQWMGMQDGKGQPLLSKELIDAGVVIIHAAADTQVMEQSFLQLRQGIGMDNTGARGGTVVAASADTNLVHDSSRNVELWGTSRLATGDWYMFLRNAPKKPTFLLDRQSAQEFSALEGDNNSDSVRDRGEEYIQFESRSGGGIALPYGAIKINN